MLYNTYPNILHSQDISFLWAIKVWPTTNDFCMFVSHQKQKANGFRGEILISKEKKIGGTFLSTLSWWIWEGLTGSATPLEFRDTTKKSNDRPARITLAYYAPVICVLDFLMIYAALSWNNMLSNSTCYLSFFVEKISSETIFHWIKNRIPLFSTGT